MKGRNVSISSLRWRTASALLATGAAAAAVVPAGASTGSQQISPDQSGYTATGAQFKTITATVFLRNPAQYAGQVASFGHSVQLWSSGLVVSFGVKASTSGGGYTTYATVYNRGTHQVIASNPNAQWCDDHDNCSPGPATLNPGHTLDWGIGYDPASGQLSMSGDYNDVSSSSVDTPSFTMHYAVPGQSFTQARVGTEFGSSPWDGSYSHIPPAQYTKIAVFSNAKLIT
jgi:hypothetical protein